MNKIKIKQSLFSSSLHLWNVSAYRDAGFLYLKKLNIMHDIFILTVYTKRKRINKTKILHDN